MTMCRLPVFTWEILATAVLILVAFPVLTAALFGLKADRHSGSHVFDPANGGAILWQHLFWFFGHPEVNIVALPFFGIVTESSRCSAGNPSSATADWSTPRSA
jgi:cytochrome c oxidase subunit 1